MPPTSGPVGPRFAIDLRNNLPNNFVPFTEDVEKIIRLISQHHLLEVKRRRVD